jgi:predicted permease
VVTPGYFETLAMAPRRGRLLTAADTQAAAKVAVVNERIARELFPVGDAIGQQIMLGPPSAAPRTIVGVVNDVAHHGLDQDPRYQVYVPQSQWAWAEGTMTLLVRSTGDPEALTQPLRRILREIDARQPVTEIESYEDIVAATTATRRLAAWLLSFFAFSAFTLAVVGLYGAVSVLVSQRQREIGVRLVLGARAGEIRALVLAKGLQPVALGLISGLALAALAVSALRSLLFGVQPFDPATFAGVVMALLAAALVACGIPAWRASRTDPAATLRAE